MGACLTYYRSNDEDKLDGIILHLSTIDQKIKELKVDISHICKYKQQPCDVVQEKNTFANLHNVNKQKEIIEKAMCVVTQTHTDEWEAI
jgi:hypothetical protein